MRAAVFADNQHYVRSWTSTLPEEPGRQGQERVLDLCKRVSADTYVNPPGGADLYSKSEFGARGIDLRFLKPRPFEYPQFGAPFVPWLSIVDVMMFNPRERVAECLRGNYDLL